MTNEKRQPGKLRPVNEHGIRAFRAAPDTYSVQIYNPEDLRRAVSELEEDDDCDGGG